MREIWIPVLLSALLGPGLGQLYNRQYKKGALLMGVSLIVVLAMMVSLGKTFLSALPSGDLESMDPMAMVSLVDRVRQEFSPDQSPGMAWGYALLTGMWIYSTVDAYRVARRRKQEAETRRAS